MKKIFMLFAMIQMMLALSGCGGKEVSGDVLDLRGEWKIVTAMGLSTENDFNEAFIRFDNDGKVNGHTSVNSFFGEYSVKGDGLTLSSIGMTRMMGPTAEIEDSVTKALNEAKTVEVNGDKAVVRGAKGNVVMELLRKQT